MLDDFREWLSDNLRYILLGAAVILLIVILVVAVRLVRGIASSGETKQKETQKVSEQIQEDETDGDSDSGTVSASSSLVKDQADILELMTEYYTARADKDYEAMADLCEVFDDATQSEVEQKDVAIESYSNIMTYSKAGMADGEYVVYVYFEAKITGIDTLAPSLREWYVITDADGKLVIANREDDSEMEAYIQSMRTDADVQALITDVNNELAQAEEADEDLKNFLENTSDSDSDAENKDDSTDDDTDASSGTSSVGTMMVTTGINVRSEADASSASYGVLYEGDTVEVLENLDSGWSHITYTSDGATIDGYVMTQYLTSVE